MVTGSGIGVPPTGVRVALKVTDWLTVGAVLDAVRVSWVGCLAAPVPSDADFVAG